MSKRQKEFEKIQKSIERLKNLPTEKILERLNNGSITPVYRRVYNEILKQRGIKK